MNIVDTLRRSLRNQVASPPTPSRENVKAVIDLTAAKVVEALQAQAMTFYLVEGNKIAFKQVYYSPTLWGADKAREKKFRDTAVKLLALRIPLGKGEVGKVIQTGKPSYYRRSVNPEKLAILNKGSGFQVKSMLTVPLKDPVTLGAIQVLNKELVAGTDGEFTDEDSALLREVAKYSSAFLHQITVLQYEPSVEAMARFASALTDLCRRPK